ncbi:hypothetical protein BOH74_12085 [Pseudomonas versuta]|uniref:Uncharacterized protein n=1 Tax=Pseudomonas versuta TaxID=1788301 RepID=A0A853ZZS2_9PSED|nr:hypothetical protein BOH74_12085 [Pseudomonas versuta]
MGASLLAMAAVRYCSCTASFVSLASQLPQWLQGLLNSTRSCTRVISTSTQSSIMQTIIQMT